MYLSHKLTFSLVFSVLLIAALTFVVVPAMAQETVTFTAKLTDATAEAAGKWEVTFKFSQGGSFNKINFTTLDTTKTPAVTIYNIVLNGVDLTADQFNAVTYSDHKLTVPIPEGTSTGPPLQFEVVGYRRIDAITATIEADAAVTLSVKANHLAGKEYRIYTRGSKDDSVRAVFPENTKVVFISNFPDDLEEFFNVGGGTIDLLLTDTSKDSKHIIINEIMWAVDNRLVGQEGYTDQQWIEIYNNTALPVADNDISFKFIEDTFPPPATAVGTADRLSNIGGFQNVWNLKGSSNGTSIKNASNPDDIIGANPAFSSMYRSKQADPGINAGSWAVSDLAFFPGFYGTPGGANTRGGLPTVRPKPTAASVPKNNIIINEVGNNSDDSLDWIELRNISGGNVNIKNWRLNYTKGTGGTTPADEINIIQFANKDTVIPAGEVLLIVNKDPVDTDLIAGIDIRESSRVNQQFGAGSHKYLNVNRSDGKNLHITNMTTGFLILRSNGDNKFKGGRQHIRDVVGVSRQILKTIDQPNGAREPEVGQYWVTEAWPLNGYSGDNYRAHNANGSNNNNASLEPTANFKDGSVWARNGTAHGWRKGGGKHVGFMGGLGYDRGVKGSGTPGYHNDSVKGKVGDIADGGLIISELMLTNDNGRAPQWIELQNTSRTRGIDLAADGSDPKNGWQMIIENHNSGSWQGGKRPLNITINLKDFGNVRYIPPNQTILITSRKVSGNKKSEYMADHRVGAVWETAAVRNKFKMLNSKSLILNAEGGFYIKIVDGDGKVSDEVGNLDGIAVDPHKEIGFDDPYSWNWPTNVTQEDNRTSLIRLMDGGTRGVQGISQGTAGTPRPGVPDRSIEGDMTGMVLPMGTPDNRRGDKAAWIHAVDLTFADVVDHTYYGDRTDSSTPLHTAGTPLPVSLSFFRPTLEDGKVTIQWTTESELDNAGFNILRSETRDGEFTQVNEQMIQGKGTTAERSTYKWVDTTAKPGAVYYYQIEDVSFAGEHTTLATTKLKGLISAKGKLTTSWGDIKNASQ